LSETVTAVQPDKAAMEKINLYTRRAYKPEEVYTFSVVLCDNEVDRDGECFTKETLEELAKLFVGKTGILDHEPTSKNQTARVFDAAVKEIPGKVTFLNEPYAQLTAQAYVPRNDGTKAFIESIESGIRKEVSVGCAVKKRVCSVCGAESCVHVPGKTYNGKRCVRILSGAADAYEFSFVAVPAQRAAGVVKKFSPRFEESEKKKEVKTVYDIVKKLADGEDSVTVAKEELNMLKTELKALFDRAECGDRYRAALCERIYKLSAVAQPEFKRGLTEAITKSLGIAELEEKLKQLDNTEKCPCCNALVRKGDAFCSKCGAALHQEEETAEKDNADVVTEDDFVPEEAAEEPVKDQKEDLVEEPGEMTENTTEEETKQEEEPVSEPEE